ncbi:MAG: SDR family oxidoreductase [Cytophagaceae bacterium]
MNLDLKGKNALVCGASQGIGRAIAAELALLGANVTLLARNQASLDEVKKDLAKSDAQQHGVLVADFSHIGELEKKVTAYVRSNPSIHILINNTGGPKGGPVADAKPEEFVQAFSNHILGNQLLVQAFLPGMKREAYGRIINITSFSVKEPIAGLGVSNTIRAAVTAWAKTLAAETGKYGITVNNVLPGYTRTGRLDSLIEGKVNASGKKQEEIESDMTKGIPLGRFALPEEVAAAAAFLATPAAAYITGTSILVDGGLTKAL